MFKGILNPTRVVLRIFGRGFSDPKFPVSTLWRHVFLQKILRINGHVSWPVHWTSQIKAPKKIQRGTRMPGLALGCYIDGRNGIEIGDNTWIGPGVKIISMNHDMQDYDSYDESGPIVIGANCWLASNCVILPGVQLGDHTVVAAGAVVSKSFVEGDQLIGGVPAKVIKKLPEYKHASTN